MKAPINTKIETYTLGVFINEKSRVCSYRTNEVKNSHKLVVMPKVGSIVMVKDKFCQQWHKCRSIEGGYSWGESWHGFSIIETNGFLNISEVTEWSDFE